MESDRAPVFENIDELKHYLHQTNAGTVVLANGCFDPLHVGHVRCLNEAKTRGDFLVVALNNDQSTRRLKGEGRPIASISDRAQLLSGLGAVDAVLIFGDDDVSGVLKALRPDVHAKGADHEIASIAELETSRELGIDSVIVGGPKTHTSSEILKRIRIKPENKGEE
jgi:rfaE bifunctional protein nucleotidyltransferase chain/domain